MIKFSLRCERGHEFESWFPDGASYDEQARRGLVQCPDCGSAEVAKAPMAPAVLGGRARAERKDEAPAPALRDEGRQAFRAAVTALRREIEAKTDDVGAKFPDVARAMHIGDEPERPIRGQAKPSEVKALLEEGVRIAPLPMLPEEAN